MSALVLATIIRVWPMPHQTTFLAYAQTGGGSALIRTMEHALARWVTYHLAAAVGLGVAAGVLALLIVGPFLFRVARGASRPPARRRR